MSNLFGLSEAAAIGLHSCTIMAADPGRVVSARGIATAMDISYDHTVTVLHRLRQAGILESRQGPQGGFLLAYPPEKMTALMVFEALEGTLSDRRCLFRSVKCEDGCRLFGPMLDAVNEMTREFFSQTTLADLAGKMTVMTDRLELARSGGRRPGADTAQKE